MKDNVNQVKQNSKLFDFPSACLSATLRSVTSRSAKGPSNSNSITNASLIPVIANPLLNYSLSDRKGLTTIWHESV